jgi:hypothetical protein
MVDARHRVALGDSFDWHAVHKRPSWKALICDDEAEVVLAEALEAPWLLDGVDAGHHEPRVHGRVPPGLLHVDRLAGHLLEARAGLLHELVAVRQDEHAPVPLSCKCAEQLGFT